LGAEGMALWSETVSGIVFSTPHYTPIQVWLEDTFHTLTEAFDKGVLTVENLTTIANRHEKFFWRDN